MGHQTRVDEGLFTMEVFHVSMSLLEVVVDYQCIDQKTEQRLGRGVGGWGGINSSFCLRQEGACLSADWF